MTVSRPRPAPQLRRSLIAAACLALCAHALIAQQTLTVPASAPLDVALVHHAPMKVGAPLTARVLYPVYVDSRLAIPATSTLQGYVVALKPNKKARRSALFYADFTPYDTPVVRFDQLTLPSGKTYAITTPDASGGTPVLHLTAATPHGKKAFLKAEFNLAKQRAKAEAALVTAPGRLDRLRQFVYSQLPWHPQRVVKGTAWTVHFSQPVTVADPAQPGKLNPTSAAAHVNHPATQASANTGAWLLDAYLTSTISSATSKPGDHFQAYVAQPVSGPHHKLVVPEGALLIGTITRSKPARRFGRKGSLRFTFNELKLPSGKSRPVQGTLAAADAARSADLRIDSEGGIAPRKRPGKLIIPLAFSLLAVHGLDSDGSPAESGATASNGGGIVGRIIGITAGSRELATGIGAYAAAQSFYNHWLARGQNVTFPQNTRIEVVTAPAPHRMAMPAASAAHTH
ncbi:MAG: hypothetical protein ACP5M4_00255 [Acidobacteriaceae bacterium]